MECSAETKLAIEGGTPIRSTPMSAWPVFDDSAIDVVSSVLKSGRVNYWTGEEGKLFEREFADYVGTSHAITLANGTLALELALRALGVGPGDEVVVPCRTFLATASCVVMCGAVPVMADVDLDSQTITAESIRQVLTPQTKAVIVVHLAGWPCEMDAILQLAEEQGLKVIEDCAQAHGATYKGKHVGSLGHVGAFSFCQDKIMTTGGEGGMLTTNDKNLWERAWSFKDHGKSYDAVYNRKHTTVFKWLHESFGTNWRLSEMQSAIGREFLQRLPEWVEMRRRNACILSDGLDDIPGLKLVCPPQDIEHSYYKYYAFLKPECLNLGWTQERIVLALQAEGIPCGTGSCSEIYLEKAFEKLGLQPSDRLPVARQLGETSIMLQVHPTLAPAELNDVCKAVRKVMSHAVNSNVDSSRHAA